MSKKKKKGVVQARGHKKGVVQARGYSEAGASVTRRATKGFIPSSSSPVEDINFNNTILRQRARMLYMSSPVATSAINTNRTKVVGTGLTLKPQINGELLRLAPEQCKTLERRISAEFSIWADKKQNCDAIGINSFVELQQLAMKSWLMSGDVFVLIKRYDPTPLNPYTLRLHVIEADRVCTPYGYVNSAYGLLTEGVVPEGEPGAGNKIHDGVEVDENGRIVAYHICSVYPNEMRKNDVTWTRVLAYGEKTGLPNILHIMDSERPEQYRGVPYLAQVIEPMLQLRRYTESELMAALVQSFFTAWIETNADQTDFPLNETGAGDIGGIPSMNPDYENLSQSPNEYEMAPGTVTHLEEGEKIVFGNPNIPTAGFETFVKTICKEMGAALELPYDVLMKEFNSSYSASRAALLEAWEAFKMRREWFVNDFCKPVYELWLSEAVAIGRVRAIGFFEDVLINRAYSGSRWIGPVQGQLDPLKEANAAILLTSHAIKTHEQITRELGGGDWNENIEQVRREDEQLEPLLKMMNPATAKETEKEGEEDE